MISYVSLVSLALVHAIYLVQAKDDSISCGACHMLVDELSWGISQIDSKKTIQVGSFRVKPDGSQYLNEIPYARSEIHIHELLETACQAAKDYLQSNDKEANKTMFLRQNRRDGQPSEVKNVVISEKTTKLLQFTCETLAEDHEDDIIKVFKQSDVENYLKAACVDVMGVCMEEDLYDVNQQPAELDRIKDALNTESQETMPDEKTSEGHTIDVTKSAQEEDPVETQADQKTEL